MAYGTGYSRSPRVAAEPEGSRDGSPSKPSDPARDPGRAAEDDGARQDNGQTARQRQRSQRIGQSSRDVTDCQQRSRPGRASPVPGGLQHVREREADLGHHHHQVHVRPGGVVLGERELLGLAHQQVDGVDAVDDQQQRQQDRAAAGCPSAGRVRTPIGISRNGSTKKGAIIQAARFTPYRIGSVWQPPARSPSMSAKSLVVDAPSTKRPKIVPMNQGSGSKIGLDRGPAGHLQQHAARDGDRDVGPDAVALGAQGRRRVGPDEHAREEHDPEALAVRLEPGGAASQARTQASSEAGDREAPGLAHASAARAAAAASACSRGRCRGRRSG